MKKIIFFLLLTYAASAFSQDLGWQRVRLICGSAWSFTSGDEYLYTAIQIPVTKKIFVGLCGGYRPQDVKTVHADFTVGYDLVTSGPNRLFFKTDGSFFVREGSFIFDARFFRQTIGLGYTSFILQKIVLTTEVAILGFYYGSRKDPPPSQKHPSVFGAGELKIGIGYKF
ncbi:MAG TPA: hypothetical protein PLH27_01145 [bacterium]|nr:hypothetical protein [bacterium]HMW33446.1 hypothetical protein [bacterium]HMW36432.1 hypothetical protein [bacterium]HMY35465.1 hypothetical protein [bacterium]HMZ03224.1 hypothetical protein [bacterium]